MSDYNSKVISLYFTRHTQTETIQQFMDCARVSEWYIYNDNTTGLPMLFLKNDRYCLAFQECSCICYCLNTQSIFIGEPSLSQTAPYMLVTLTVVGLICYILYCWLF